jgi:hypothetical protein
MIDLEKLTVSEFKVDRHGHLLSAVFNFKDECGKHSIKVSNFNATDTVWNPEAVRRERLEFSDYMAVRNHAHTLWHKVRRSYK